MPRSPMRYVLGVALTGLACAPPGGDTSSDAGLDAVEVGAATDAGYLPDEDQREAARGPALRGVLPGDYPADLPTYTPASLVDFGDRQDGGRFVELHTSTAPAEVRAAIERELARLGWQAMAANRYRKAGREAMVSVAAAGAPGTTLIRVEYRLPGSAQ